MKTDLEPGIYFVHSYSGYEPLDWTQVRGNEEYITNLLIREEETPNEEAEMFFAKIVTDVEVMVDIAHEALMDSYNTKMQALNQKRANKLKAKARKEKNKADKHLLKAKQLLEKRGYKVTK